ncbi:MAG: hypothetical protein RBU37_21615 [Myxococcota bacterium]|nr:hypothetical protein [Myxococcota bacterium]
MTRRSLRGQELMGAAGVGKYSTAKDAELAKEHRGEMKVSAVPLSTSDKPHRGFPAPQQSLQLQRPPLSTSNKLHRGFPRNAGRSWSERPSERQLGVNPPPTLSASLASLAVPFYSPSLRVPRAS